MILRGWCCTLPDCTEHQVQEGSQASVPSMHPHLQQHIDQALALEHLHKKNREQLCNSSSSKQHLFGHIADMMRPAISPLSLLAELEMPDSIAEIRSLHEICVPAVYGTVVVEHMLPGLGCWPVRSQGPVHQISRAVVYSTWVLMICLGYAHPCKRSA